MKSPLYVIFLSAWGMAHDTQENIFQSQDPFLEHILASYPIALLQSAPKATSFIDVYKTLGAVISPEQHLTALLAREGIKQRKIAGPDRFGLLTEVFNGGEVIQEKEEQIYLEYPHGPSLKDTPELEVTSLVKELEQSFVHKRDTVTYASIAQLWALAQYKDASLLKEGAQYLSKVLQQFVDRAVHEGARVLLVADSSAGESYAEAFSSDPIRTEALLPCVLIHTSVEGLRAQGPDQSPLGSLEDIAPTIAALMGVQQPDWMPGKPLFSGLIERAI